MSKLVSPIYDQYITANYGKGNVVRLRTPKLPKVRFVLVTSNKSVTGPWTKFK